VGIHTRKQTAVLCFRPQTGAKVSRGFPPMTVYYGRIQKMGALESVAVSSRTQNMKGIANET